MASHKWVPVLTDNTVYSSWKKELAFWKHATKCEKEKQAHTVILAMAGKPRTVATQLDPDSLAVEDGLDILIREMDKLFLKDNTQQLFCAIDTFEKFRRPKAMSMDDYIAEFTRLYQCVVECRDKKDVYEDGVLAYKMLMQAELSNDDQRIVKAITKPLTVTVMTETLKRVFGDGLGSTGLGSSLPYKSDNSAVIKEEPIFLTKQNDHEENGAYYNSYQDQEEFDDMEGGIYWNQNPRKFFRGNQRGNWQQNNYPKGPGRYQSNFQQNNQPAQQSQQLNMGARGRFNPYNRGKGNMQKKQCFICSDPGHFVSECPYNSFNNTKNQSESQPTKDKVFAVFEPDFILPDSDEELVFLTGETTNQALLDTGACATVCGKEWMQVFEDSLTVSEQSLIDTESCQRFFKFGDGKAVESKVQKVIPLMICDKEMFVRTYIVDNDIPLLLSRQTMSNMGMVIDLENMLVKVRDSNEHQIIEMTKSGHIVLAIGRCIMSQNVGRKKDAAGAILQVESLDAEKTANHLHRYYAHASSSKIGTLLSKAKVANCEEIIDHLKQIEKRCNFCLKHKSRKTPHRKVGMPHGYNFNEVVAMDLKMLDCGQLLLHLVDTVTRYSAASSIRNKGAKEILNKVFRHWIAVFGIPGTFISDNGGEFVNDAFNQMCSLLNIRIKTSPAESPWCQGVVERHNGILAAMIKSVMEEVGCDVDVAAAWACSAKNSLGNNHGFSSNQLVLGLNPRIPGILNDTVSLSTLNSEDIEATVSEHLNALVVARQKFVELEASDKVKRALKERVYEQQNIKYYSGDVVYFKRGEKKFWYGPAVVVGHVDNNVLIKHGGLIVRVHPCKVVLQSVASDQIKSKDAETDRLPAKKQNITETDLTPLIISDSEDDEVQSGESGIVQVQKKSLPIDKPQGSSKFTNDQELDKPDGKNDKDQNESASGWIGIADKENSVKIKLNNGDIIRYKTDSVEPWKYGLIDSKVPKSHTNQSRNCFNIQQDGNEETIKVDLEKCDVEKQVSEEASHETLVIEDSVDSIYAIDSDNNINQVKEKEAKDKELNRLKEFNTYKEVKDGGQSFVSSRWVITCRKNIIKARLVARGFEEYGGFQTDAPTISKSSLRLMYTVTASHGWKIQTLDITSAFLQSSEMTREVYLKPPVDIKKKGILWKLLKPIYGLGDSPRRWYSTLREHLLKNGCKISKLDKCIFTYYECGKLQGIITVHVDDVLYSGTLKFQKTVIGSVLKVFKISRMDSGIFIHLGWSVKQAEDSITVDQQSFAEKIRPAIIPQTRKQSTDIKLSDEEKKIFQALLGKLLWLSGQTRPDLSYDVLELSTVAKDPTIRDLMNMNKVIKKIGDGPKNICFRSLDLYHEDLNITFFSDASLGKLPNNSSARGYLVFLCHGSETNLISWSSKKVKRVVHSTFGAETLACVDGAAAAIHVRQILSEMLYDDPRSKVIPIIGYIDSKQLHDSINSTKQCEDKKMQLDIAELQESLETGEITKIEWVPTGKMLADCLTKKGVNTDILCDVLENARFPM